MCNTQLLVHMFSYLIIDIPLWNHFHFPKGIFCGFLKARRSTGLTYATWSKIRGGKEWLSSNTVEDVA
ncbi:hypothetical protein RIF29_17317 [Crotalaria pallida]|uniref:Uncharacterized protein n=1 Tax=Crotalaria pallida TaxID=3830 RepID=A0AAN9FGU2_CROPI